MDRRAFLSALSGSLLAAPLAVGAQQAGKVYRIGSFVQTMPPTPPGQGPLYDRMRELGWVHGQNYVVERGIEGDQFEHVHGLATEWLRSGVDMFLVSGVIVARRVQQVTRTIPIVTIAAGDLVAGGLATSLARPGGNVSGVQAVGPAVVAKEIELLKECVPGLSRVGVLTAGYDPAVMNSVEAVEARAKALGIRLQFVSVSRLEDFARAFSTLRGGRAQGILVVRTPITSTYRKTLVDLALKHRLPAISEVEFFASDGGLLSYGFDLREAFRLVAETIAEILGGAQASEVPIRQVTTFRLIINLKTAKALGLTIPPSLLARADQVIE
jgi:putative ABC transport system substrate-binding protein